MSAEPLIQLSIAGTVFCFRSAVPTAPLQIPDAWRAFSTPQATTPDSIYQIERESDQRDSSAEVYWGNALWRATHAATGETCFEIAKNNGAAWRLGGLFSPDLATGALFHHSLAVSPLDPIPFPLEHPLLIGRLAFLNAIVVHASCVMFENRGYLFVGKSGAGKTTMARLWRQQGATILNDERNVIRLLSGRAYVSSSPWHGEENSVHPAQVPLAAIHFIRHAAGNSLETMPPGIASARLLQSTFIPVFLPHGMELALNTTAHILTTVPAYDTGFIPDAAAAQMIQAAQGPAPAPVFASPKAHTL